MKWSNLFVFLGYACTGGQHCRTYNKHAYKGADEFERDCELDPACKAYMYYDNYGSAKGRGYICPTIDPPYPGGAWKICRKPTGTSIYIIGI